MLSRKNKLLLMKILSLFSVVRGYNIPIIILAQYLAAIFILAPEKGALSILLDFNLFILVLASSLTIASGYIINNFYDSQKDLINRPNKSMLDRLVSRKTKLQVYFTLNFIVTALAFLVSWRAVLFFAVYIFAIWFYSHKIKKLPVIGNLMAALLAVLPFFGILLYYKNFYAVIFGHAIFLFLLILIREMIKDLENIKGDLANGYQTIPILYGEAVSKKIITVLTILTVFPVYILIEIYDVGYMDIYFYASMIILVLFLVYLWKSKTKEEFLLLHNTLKFLIVAGVFCIVLIDPVVLLRGRTILLSI
ncbi:geranylgeranylglycerol-phosphate geranylgeranyltransferase [Flavobacterium sp. '19STA2R22 D10 B1']|uniref:geranylgeranylglycerol-phosphate geranylgeranyltransferase n=1 Tax=Flavobacterium aerium TaxID=3037261 RepID=UPI00278C2D7A|nr:geranylgeranylglycerol-phosphate geranylgeranyltransferase [Flavobacterium sp. '19STA2R22 D10 B1']